MQNKVIVHGKGGKTIYDLNAAEAVQNREWQAAMKDLERLGMSQSADGHINTPRALVHPASNVPGGEPGLQGARFPLPAGAEPYRDIIEEHLKRNGGMGELSDIHSQVTSPGERYWETWRNPRLPAKWGQPGKPARQAVYVQPMSWLAPPVTAIAVDVFTPAAGVELTGSYPGPGACVDVLSIDVPDRFILILDRFANELEDHDSFGDVRFSMMRNETPIRSYGDFDVQLGRFDDPTKFGSPIILKHKDQFRLKAQALGGVNHVAFARLIGWAFAVRQTSGDGSHSEYVV